MEYRTLALLNETWSYIVWRYWIIIDGAHIFSLSHLQSRYRHGHSNDKVSKSKNWNLHHLTNLNCIPSTSFDYIIQMHSFQLDHLQQQKLPNSNLHGGYSKKKMVLPTENQWSEKKLDII